MASRKLIGFFYWLGVTLKSGRKVKKGGMKAKKNNTKIGVTKVLIKLQQKCFLL